MNAAVLGCRQQEPHSEGGRRVEGDISGHIPGNDKAGSDITCGGPDEPILGPITKRAVESTSETRAS